MSDFPLRSSCCECYACLRLVCALRKISLPNLCALSDLWDWTPKYQNVLSLHWRRSCTTCRIPLLSSESVSSSFCCGPNGKHGRNYIPLPALPRQYDSFTDTPNISAMSRKLNLAYSLASTATTMEFPNFRGDHMVAIRGRVYHRIRPDHNSSPIHWILYDGFESSSNPHTSRHTEDMPLSWTRAFKSSLRDVNPFYRQLANLAELPTSIPNVRVELREEGVASEIAALIRFDDTSINEVAPRTLQIYRDASLNRKQTIRATSSLWEPLAYPLLFPHGSLGWGVNSGEYYVSHI